MTAVVAPNTPLPTPPEAEGGEELTKEQVVVAALAQVIIQGFPQPKQALPRPFDLDKPKKEESKETDKPKPQEKSAPKERSATKPATSKAAEKPKAATKSAEAGRKAPVEKGRAEVRVTQSAASTSQPLQQMASKPQVPPPPHFAKAPTERGHTPKEMGTSRRAMPQTREPATHTAGLPTPEDRKVDPDAERERQRFRGTKSRVSGSGKVAAVATRTLAKKESLTKEQERDFNYFLQQMRQDSDLSEFLGLRVSHFDVLLLFIEVMKLEVENGHQERIARLDERKYQIEWMGSIIKKYKQQANFQLFAGIGAGVLGIVAGMLPIVGHMKGKWILDKLKFVSKGFASMKPEKAFTGLSESVRQMGEMNKAMGQVQATFCEGEKTWAEHKSSLHRSDGEESTRTIEEHSREFKTWRDVLESVLRMEQDLVRQLYN